MVLFEGVEGLSVNYWIALTEEEVKDIFTTVMNRLDTGYIPSQEFAKAI